MSKNDFSNLALSDKGFLFDTRTGNTFTLNETASFILDHLIKGVDPESIPLLLIQNYQVNKKTAENDFSVFLGFLLENRLIDEAIKTR